MPWAPKREITMSRKEADNALCSSLHLEQSVNFLRQFINMGMGRCKWPIEKKNVWKKMSV